MNQLTQVLQEIEFIQASKNIKWHSDKFNYNILINNILRSFRVFGLKLFYFIGMAIAKCLGRSLIFSITNKHHMMGEHSR